MTDLLNIQQYHHDITEQLSQVYDTREAQSISRVLLTYATDQSWFELNCDNLRSLSPAELSIIQSALPKLLAGCPIQHITTTAHFYGRTFTVSPEVLIPRQETEELTIWVRDSLKGHPSDFPVQVLDLGTGSGCIPITLALEWDQLKIPHHITGIDLSAHALQIAQQNAQNLHANVHWKHLDIFNPIFGFNNLDIVISNPPYIPHSEKDTLHPNVRDYEPPIALYVPDEDPLIFYRQISALARQWLKPNGMLFFEIHTDTGSIIVQLLQAHGWEDIQLRKDLSGKDRMIRCIHKQ